MIFELDLETFKQMMAGGGEPLLYQEHENKIILYRQAGASVFKAIYQKPVKSTEIDGQEVVVPSDEEVLMFKESFLKQAIQVLNAKEESRLKLSLDGNC